MQRHSELPAQHWRRGGKRKINCGYRFICSNRKQLEYSLSLLKSLTDKRSLLFLIICLIMHKIQTPGALMGKPWWCISTNTHVTLIRCTFSELFKIYRPLKSSQQVSENTQVTHQPCDSLLQGNVLLKTPRTKETRLQGEQGSQGENICGRKKQWQITAAISNSPSFLFHAVIARLTGKQGMFSSLRKESGDNQAYCTTEEII